MRVNLTELVHECLRDHLQEGDVVIDATAGNGHDTLLLAEQVGAEGCVFAFDKQRDAIANTQQRLSSAGVRAYVQCLCTGHEAMAAHIDSQHHGKVAAVVFNLGYLPGGDKQQITQAATSLQALEQAFAVLREGGLLSVMLYPGHEGGREEAEAIKAWAASLNAAEQRLTIAPSRNNNAPQWLLIHKRPVT